jgi:hypothetical protein
MTLLLALISAPAYGKESEDLQIQLILAEDGLNTARYCTDNLSKSAIEWDGFIAVSKQGLVDNPGNQSVIDQIRAHTEQRAEIGRMLADCIGLVSTRSATVADLRTRLAAALAAETATAAEEAKKKVLSEKETKDAVASATTEVDATKQRIQTDSFNVNDAISKIETLNSSLETLDKNSTTYKEVQASIAALTSIKESSEARLQQNVELQKAQKALLAELSAIQNNAVKVNAAAAVDLLSSSKEAQANLDQQADVLGKEVITLEDQVKKIEELLTRISKDSPDYAKLVSTRDSLVSSIKQVKVEQEEVKEAARKNEELAEEAKKETLPSRLESSILGKILGDDEKPGVVNFKAKRVNAKFSEVTTKLVDSSDEDLAELGLEADDLEGLKISLKSGKKTIKVNKVELNEDGTLSFRIPRATKSGTYTMSVDIPDSDDDLSLKVKIRN